MEPNGWYWVKINKEWTIGKVSESGDLIETLDYHYIIESLDEVGEQILRKTE